MLYKGHVISLWIFSSTNIVIGLLIIFVSLYSGTYIFLSAQMKIHFLLERDGYVNWIFVVFHAFHWISSIKYATDFPDGLEAS
jgi:hypothetical protein